MTIDTPSPELEETRPAGPDGASAEHEPDWVDTQEWVDSLRDVTRTRGAARASRLLQALQIEAQRAGIPLPVTSTTPYVNTIPPEHQAPFPGDRELERRIKSVIRWNAMAMVTEANSKASGIGGHISTYASAATLYEVGFNHFFRGPDDPTGGDLIYFQGHASPGIYARSYLEGRLSPQQLHHFRREFAEEGGLPSYPAPLADARLLAVPDPCRWAWGQSWPSTRPASCATSRIGGSRNRTARRSGASSAMARPTSPSRSARSRWLPARGSTT